MQNNPPFGSDVNKEGQGDAGFAVDPLGFFLKKSKTVVEKGSETIQYYGGAIAETQVAGQIAGMAHNAKDKGYEVGSAVGSSMYAAGTSGLQKVKENEYVGAAVEKGKSAFWSVGGAVSTAGWGAFSAMKSYVQGAPADTPQEAPASELQ